MSEEFSYCPKCGEELQPDWQVCPKCGETLAQQEQPPDGSMDEEARRKQRKGIWITVGIVVVWLLIGAPTDTGEALNVFTDTGRSGLESHNINEPFTVENFEMTVKDVELAKELPDWTGVSSSDTRSPLGGVGSSFVEGLAEGVASGLSSDTDEYDPDAWLVVYLDMRSHWERPKTADDLDFEVKDHGDVEYNRSFSLSSVGHGAMQPEEKYRERLVFPILSDAEDLELRVDDEALVHLGTPGFE